MERLKQLRKENGLSQQRLSMETGIAQVTVSEYESGRNFPSVKTLLRLAEFFGVSTDYLLGLTDIRGTLRSGVSDDEAELLNNYRSLPPSERLLVRSYLQALCDRRGKQDCTNLPKKR